MFSMEKRESRGEAADVSFDDLGLHLDANEALRDAERATVHEDARDTGMDEDMMPLGLKALSAMHGHAAACKSMIEGMVGKALSFSMGTEDDEDNASLNRDAADFDRLAQQGAADFSSGDRSAMHELFSGETQPSANTEGPKPLIVEDASAREPRSARPMATEYEGLVSQGADRAGRDRSGEEVSFNNDMARGETPPAPRSAFPPSASSSDWYQPFDHSLLDAAPAASGSDDDDRSRNDTDERPPATATYIYPHVYDGPERMAPPDRLPAPPTGTHPSFKEAWDEKQRQAVASASPILHPSEHGKAIKALSKAHAEAVKCMGMCKGLIEKHYPPVAKDAFSASVVLKHLLDDYGL